MTEKNPDYTNSAENLSNPDEVKILLDKLHQHQGHLSSYEDELHNANKVIVSNIDAEKEAITQVVANLRVAIEKFGSYQDIESGEYAVKYRRMKSSYCVEAFKELFPKYVSAVVEETINVKALEGMVKGKLINEEELTAKVAPVYRHPVISQETQYAFFIR